MGLTKEADGLLKSRKQIPNNKPTKHYTFMKRLFVLLFGCALSVAMMAQKQELPQTIQGCSLGSTTQDDAVYILLEQGLDVLSDSSKITVRGDMNFEGFSFNSATFTFVNNRLFYVIAAQMCIAPDCVEIAKKEIHLINSKYNQLGDGTQEAILQDFVKNFFNNEKPYTAKFDNRTYLASIVYDDGVALCLINYNDYKIAAEFKSILQDLDPKNKVTGVAGVEFGKPYSQIRPQFNYKFGTPLEENSHEISYSNATIGGHRYDIASFYFAINPDTKLNCLVAAKLSNSFHSWERDKAYEVYNTIVSQFSRKYQNTHEGEFEGNGKFCQMGMVQDDHYPIFISMEKSLSRGGEWRWYVTVSYFSYRLTSIYDDEI